MFDCSVWLFCGILAPYRTLLTFAIVILHTTMSASPAPSSKKEKEHKEHKEHKESKESKEKDTFNQLDEQFQVLDHHDPEIIFPAELEMIKEIRTQRPELVCYLTIEKKFQTTHTRSRRKNQTSSFVCSCAPVDIMYQTPSNC